MLAMKKMRDERGLSLRKLGALCSPPVNATYLCNMERWGHGYPGHIERVAAVLGCDPADLLLEVDAKEA